MGDGGGMAAGFEGVDEQTHAPLQHECAGKGEQVEDGIDASGQGDGETGGGGGVGQRAGARKQAVGDPQQVMLVGGLGDDQQQGERASDMPPPSRCTVLMPRWASRVDSRPMRK